MNKFSKKFSVVLVALFTAFTALSYMPAKAAIVVPKVQYVEAPQLVYNAGDRVQFNLYAPNYGGRVQYRVVLWNDETKSYRDLWTTGDRYYTNWQPYGNNVFTLGWPISEPGHYRITIYTKRAGIANSKTALNGQNCDSYMESQPFVVNAKAAEATVASIAPVADVTVNQGDAAVLPTQVTLNMSDNTTKTASVTWASVDTTKLGTVAVEGTVVETELKAKANVTVKAVDLAVKSVKALNNKQLEVVFNKAVDEETAIDEDNYSIDSDNTDLTVEGADFTLSADAKTLVITLPVAADQQDTADLTIDGVEGLAKTTVKDILFLDTTLPKAVKAEVIGNDTIKITFSEPVTDVEASDFEVNGGDLYIKEVTVANNNTEANVVVYSTLESGKVSVTVGNDIEDYAGYNILKTILETTVVEDTSAPVVVGYKDATPNSVTLIFNEEIEIADGVVANFYHTNSKNTVDDTVVAADVDGKELTLDFTTNNLPEGTAYVYVLADAVNDLWDNENDKIMVPVKVEVDTVKPVLEGLEVSAEDELVLTFSEDIDAADEDNFTILDENGDEIDNIIDGVSLDEDTITLSLDDKLAGDYSIVIEDLEDIVGNVIADTTKEFTVDDLTAPLYTEFEAVLYNPGVEGQMIKVNFDQVMSISGKYSVLDAERYQIGSYNLADLANSIKAVDGGKAVEITIADASEDDGVNLTIANDITLARVADAAGNYTSALSGLIDVVAQGNVAIEKVAATGINTVVVEFDDFFTSFDAKDIQLSYNDGAEKDLTITKVSTSVNADGNTKVTFTVSEDLTYDGKLGTSTVYADVVATNSENKYSETLLADATKNAVDEITPVVAEITVDGDEVANVEAQAGKVLITFEEEINTASLSSKTFVVNGYTVTSVAAVGNIVTINVTPVDTNPATPELGTSVTQKVSLEDMSGNNVSGLSLKVVK